MLNDVAINGLDVRRIVAGERPIFFENNNGREPLFIYFQALLVAVAGSPPLVFTFSSAVMGLLSVATVYRLFRVQFGWPIAAITGLLLATSFWFVDISRMGLRTISLLPLGRHAALPVAGP
jgi:4-amino-4-deoxy-L-arabinose transferase-like glycosyltransferase